LNSLERQAQTLQLALEILSEYLASGLSTPGSALDGGDDAEDEEWGGISMDVEEGDLAMDEDDEDVTEVIGGTNGAVDEDLEGDDSEMDGDEMLEDLENIVGDSSDDEEEDAAPSTKATLTSLPMSLLALSQNTSVSFIPATSFSSTPGGADPSTGLISTAASSSSSVPTYPAALSTLSEALTTIHVRAIEALNNLFVALSKAKKPYGRGKGKEKELQTVFEKVLEGMHTALTAQEGAKKADKKPSGQGEEEVDEVEERREELVSASDGVVWGCTRLGLEEGGSLVRFHVALTFVSFDANSSSLLLQIVGPSATPFLVQNVYGSPFASAATPQGEAIRVRVLGALGCIGRRKDVPVEENAVSISSSSGVRRLFPDTLLHSQQIGQFLLSLLPQAPVRGAPPPSNQSHLTPDALLQVVDSFIDLYADEEREYDVPNFRNGGMLAIIEQSIAGVRAAVRYSLSMCRLLPGLLD
jgi:hypothetical protein